MAKDSCQWEPTKGCNQYVLARWVKGVWEPDSALVPVEPCARFSPAAPCGCAYDYHFGIGEGATRLVSLILCVDRKITEGELEEIPQYKPSKDEPCGQWPDEMFRFNDPEAKGTCDDGGEWCE